MMNLIQSMILIAIFLMKTKFKFQKCKLIILFNNIKPNFNHLIYNLIIILFIINF